MDLGQATHPEQPDSTRGGRSIVANIFQTLLKARSELVSGQYSKWSQLTHTYSDTSRLPRYLLSILRPVLWGQEFAACQRRDPH
jgi:hypothetical protein